MVTYFCRKKKERNEKNWSRSWQKTTEKLKKPRKSW
jgi:hypothetical protein